MCTDTACLCDVTPIGVTITRDAVYDMWLGERVCEILGYNSGLGHEWTKSDILTYLETLVEVHDKFIETGGYLAYSLDEIQPLQMSGNKANDWKHIRDSVLLYAKQYPEVPVLDIIKKLGLSLPQFIEAVTVNKARHIMTEQEFQSLCAACLADKPNFAKIGRDHQTGKNTMGYYKKLFRTIKTAKTDA